MRPCAALPMPLKVYVSASSRGLGFAIALRLAKGGADVALSSRDRSHVEGARLRILTECPNVRVLAFEGDVGDPTDQERIMSELDTADFRPDVFVSNCGQPADDGLAAITRAGWRHDVGMMLDQAVFSAQRFVPEMARRGYGRMILISSIYAKAPVATAVASSVARAGLLALSKTLVAEYAEHGVASFPLCLGYVDTPLLRNMALELPFDAPDPASVGDPKWLAKYEQWAGGIPARRIATPEELAELVAFLVTPAAEYLNGTVFSFAGGLDKGLI